MISFVSITNIIIEVMDENEIKKGESDNNNIVEDKSYKPETSQKSEENKVVYDDEDAAQGEKIDANKQKMRKYVTTIIVIVCLIVLAIWAAKSCESSFNAFTY